MINLVPFRPKDFDALISWVDTEEMLFTIAGKDLSFPLTKEQLEHYLDEKDSYSFSVVDSGDGTLIGHAEIRRWNKQTFKIDKVIIGGRSARGQGLGKQIIDRLLAFAFSELQAETVELNVFDWNEAGIRCYESCGFVMNPERTKDFQFQDKVWVAFNMVIGKTRWQSRH